MRFINKISLFLTLLVGLTLLPACGKDRGVGKVITGSNGAGIEGSFTPTRVDGAWVIGVVHLQNNTSGTVNFNNFQMGSSYPGFKLAVESQPPVAAIQDFRYNPWIGVVSTGNSAQLTELPKGSAVDLEFKWKLLSAPSTKKNYAFVVIVSNLTQGGVAVKDVTMHRTPGE